MTAAEKSSEEVTSYAILEETGPGDILLFGCRECGPGKKITSHQLESHMRDRHYASKFRVVVPTAPKSRSKKATASTAGAG